MAYTRTGMYRHSLQSFGAKKPFSPSLPPAINHRAVQRLRRCLATTELTAEAVKSKVVQMAGPKHGIDKSPGEKQEIADVACQLADLDRIDQIDMRCSRWKLVFTESTASSSGKVGPFVGRTEQEFPADKPGQYINWLFLGPVKASLLADYTQTTRDRIDVSFVYLQVEAGPFKWKKEFKNRGTWDLIYIDNDLRVFRTNKKNLFVLTKI